MRQTMAADAFATLVSTMYTRVELLRNLTEASIDLFRALELSAKLWYSGAVEPHVLVLHSCGAPVDADASDEAGGPLRKGGDTPSQSACGADAVARRSHLHR